MANAKTPNKCSGSKHQKAIWKKWWFWAVIVVILGAVGSSSEDTTQQPETETVVKNEQETEQIQVTESEQETEPTKATESEQEVLSADKFVETVKAEIKGAVGEGEVITDVILENKDLCVYVDLSSTVQQLPIPLEDLAIGRTCSITDEILELVQYENLWETITVDFGELGYIRNGKDNIKDDGYGKYFSSENFKLEIGTENELETEQTSEYNGKNIDDVNAHFSVSKVRNDVVGNWRISSIAESINIEEYALSYYKKYFSDNSEIHAVVNFSYNTTTKISVVGNALDVSIYEYVDGEEHDAKLLFSGMLLKQYFVYIDTGEIEEIQ